MLSLELHKLKLYQSVYFEKEIIYNFTYIDGFGGS